MSEQTKSPAVTPFALASAAATLLGVVVAVLLPEGVRVAAVAGVVAAAMGAVCALSALVAVGNRGTQGVLLGFTVGFLARGLFVALGLVASGARGNAALVYVAFFFALYAATQLVEILYVAKSARPGVPGDAR